MPEVKTKSTTTRAITLAEEDGAFEDGYPDRRTGDLAVTDPARSLTGIAAVVGPWSSRSIGGFGRSGMMAVLIRPCPTPCPEGAC
jgi:hypothetical protein